MDFFVGGGLYFLEVALRKKFVTFEKTNSFKCGGVRDGFGGLVMIIIGGRCFWGGTERKKFLLLKKQTPSNAVECVLGLVDLLR